MEIDRNAYEGGKDTGREGGCFECTKNLGKKLLLFFDFSIYTKSKSY